MERNLPAEAAPVSGSAGPIAPTYDGVTVVTPPNGKKPPPPKNGLKNGLTAVWKNGLVAVSPLTNGTIVPFAIIPLGSAVAWAVRGLKVVANGSNSGLNVPWNGDTVGVVTT